MDTLVRTGTFFRPRYAGAKKRPNQCDRSYNEPFGPELEVQFQKDEQLYERLFGESFLYFYRQRQLFDDWQAVVIYPSRAVEQVETHPYRALLKSDQVHRIYLDELGDLQQLPLNVGLLVLTAANKNKAPEQARSLLSRTQQEDISSREQQAIIELIITIMVYQFTQMTRQEVETMLGLTTLQDTRVYRDAKQEGREEGLAQERAFVMRLLKRKVGELPEAIASRVESLAIESLEDLGEALLDFESLADLESWLQQKEEERTRTEERGRRNEERM